MVSIFFDMVERFMEVFMDNFSVFGSSFDKCLDHFSLPFIDQMLEWLAGDRFYRFLD